MVKAIEEWRKQLVDLTGNNRLIYYKALKVGTLSFDDAQHDAGYAMSKRKETRLSRLFEPESDEFGSQLKRAQSIASQGLTNFEEKGISTLYLVSHVATWNAGGKTAATPNAPVLLAPLAIAPVSGSRTDFTFQVTGDWQINETLLIFWKELFGVELDRVELGAMVDANGDDADTIVDGLKKLARSAGQIPELGFREASFCGNFSYTKLPMVKDIEENLEALLDNQILVAMSGDTDVAADLRNDNAPDGIDLSLPDRLEPKNEFLILDADSSQSFVINAAVAGKSMIVQGPPGTGKSQTIANLIATLAARGKTTLFVAEKRAAIEAVSKRLDATGLGDLALDLHGSERNKKSTAVALATSLESLSSAVSSQHSTNQGRLTTDRQRLIDYERELHLSRQPWEVSSFDVNSELLSFGPDLKTVKFDHQTIESFTDTHIGRVQETLARWIETRLVLDWTSGWLNAPIHDVESADLLADTARSLRTKTLPMLTKAVASVDRALAQDASDKTLDQLSRICDLMNRVETVEMQLDARIWPLDTFTMAQVLSKKKFFGGPGKLYRAKRSEFENLALEKVSNSERLELLKEVNDIWAQWISMELDGSPVACVKATEVINLNRVLVNEARCLGGALPEDPSESSLVSLTRSVGELDDTSSTASQYGQMQRYRSVLTDHGCLPLVEFVESGEVPEQDADDVLRYSALRGIQSEITDRNPVLNTFRSESHDAAVEKFGEGDRWHIASAPQRVLRAVAERALDARNLHPKQSSIISREAKKKTRHRSLRRLQEDAGEVLIKLRPCWMMSPLMVAQTLPARPIFDYVIFDEASQVRPAEAVSAILRGKNLIVAGDEHQLPPTSFFDAATEEGELDEDEDDALTTGYESILDVTSALLPFKMLNWHYRSEDDRLIRLSNEEIYGGSLTTFPGVSLKTPISFHKVSHTTRSSSEIRSNATEVAKVVELMIEHAETLPEASLGVIAFGSHHARAIENRLYEELERLGSSTLDAFFDVERPERAFIKNIESVQGDERDVIILTIGYGKNEAGVVPNRFGPVNKKGGERRINVAASRSRQRMMIVSSITSGDLQVESLSRGPQMLKKLIRFAETGGEDLGHEQERQPLNPFEQAVKTELEKVGLDPICQYGVGSYRLDFVLAHPSNDGRMVLAVEADGASYHSSSTARDRDRLRQGMLERLGWRFCRIWSTSFFANPQGEAQRVRDAYDAALSGEPRKEPGSSSYRAAPAAPVRKHRKPNLLQGVPISQHDHLKLVALVRYLTEGGERLIDDLELKELMKMELGYGRLGSKIDGAFSSAIRSARR